MRKSPVALALFVASVAVLASGCRALDKDTYQPCFATSDCSQVSDTCVLVMSSSSDRMCSRPCSVGTDCPTSRDGTSFGVCLPVASGDNFCYSRCSSDSDCAIGWICNTGTIRGAACTPR